EAMLNLAIVVPCYNEQEALPHTLPELAAVRERLIRAGRISADSRIYFVDDGSRDDTWRTIERFVAAGEPVVGIKLSRNRGHQNALLAGLLSARGDALISVDADLQDDLGVIDTMVERYSQGIDVVYGVRKSRATDSFFKRFTAETFYRLLTWMGVQTIHNHADYRLMSRRAIEALREYPEVNLYLRGIVPLIGFETCTVEYDRSPRVAGETKYPFRKMLALAVQAVTSFSIMPLRLIALMGLVVFVGSLFVSAWTLWVALVAHRTVPGWTSTVLPIYFLGGAQLLSLGVIGEYLGKIYLEAKQRPRFLVEQVIGVPTERT
ncbi:MAG TPA: glycosyltransferase family 2 protein, partial [Steroidobacteraceae bacterium]|nr:glycosyltransferase family 2 protein [Steroidobacteraceae bacterium]